MNAIFGLSYLLGTTIWSASAKGDLKPMTVPLAKMGDVELNAVLPSEKSLILLAIAIQIIWYLWTTIQKARDKKADKSEEKLDSTASRLLKIESDLSVFMTEVRGELRKIESIIKDRPSESDIVKSLEHRIELMAYRAVREHLKDKR